MAGGASAVTVRVAVRCVAVTAVLALASTAAAGSLEDGTAAWSSGNVELALQLLQPLAGEGDAEAQFYLGR